MFNQIILKYTNNETSRNFTDYGLGGIRSIMSRLKNPHEKLKSIHIAGTNGKGTTALCLATLFQALGLKTGLFTSPHLLKYNERIKIDLENISLQSLDYYANLIDREMERLDRRVTLFDFLTAMAFQIFHEESVDVAIIETGMGGRLDSTNIITPTISIITEISFDHQGILGKTMDEITLEKAGIIKRGVPVITCNNKRAVIETIKNVALERDSNIIMEGQDYITKLEEKTPAGIKFTYDNFNLSFDFKTPMILPHQISNISMAITSLIKYCEQERIPFDGSTIEETLGDFQVPGRFEKICSEPNIFYDVAHNFGALHSLFEQVREIFKNTKITFVLTLLQDKVTPEVKKFLIENQEDIIYFNSELSGGLVPDKELMLEIFNTSDIISFLRMKNHSNEIFVFTGTFRNYREVIEIVGKIKNEQNA